MVLQHNATRSSTRLLYLDGLRGIAALLVLWFHFFCAYCYALIPEQTSAPMTIADTPLAFLYNGPFCVIVFFVLSGFVLSQSAARNRDGLAVNLGIRYVRLALPATASILFAWTLLSLFPNESLKLFAFMPHGWLKGSYQEQLPPLSSALFSGFFSIFFSDTSLWNNALWTMRLELIGSCALYIIFTIQNANIRLGILILASLLLITLDKGIYEGFGLGGILSELVSQRRLPTRLSKTALAMGILLGFEGHDFPVRMHLHRLPIVFTLGEPNSIWYAVGAALIVYSCLISQRIQAALSIRPVQFLGRISFALYLCHVPLLYTVFAKAYIALLPMHIWKLLCLFLFFVIVSIAVALLGTIIVDEPVLRLTTILREQSRSVF